MTQVDYRIPILNKDSIAIQELEATVDVTINIINGQPIVEVDSFEAEALNGDFLIYSPYCDDTFMRQIFLRGKEALESDDAQTDRAFYLEAFNGDGHFTYDRIGRGTVHIENATISMIGGIQPARIAPLVYNAITGKGDDGLIQRLQMAVWPDDVANWQWVDRHPDREAR